MADVEVATTTSSSLENKVGENSLTFPLRPGKRRVLVRRKVAKEKAAEYDTVNDDPAKSVAAPSRGRKMFVARKIPKSDLSRLNTAEGTYNSPLGKLSPSKKQSSLKGPRSDPNGRILPYTILGTVEDFSKLKGATKSTETHNVRGMSGTVKSSHRQTRTSSRRASRTVEQLRSQMSKRSLLSEGERSAMSSKDDFLRKVREQISRETKARGEALQVIEEKERQEERARMLVHERIAFDRQDRALHAWKRWQHEWGRFKKVMCKRLKKNVDDLVVSRSEGYREVLEEYDAIAAATPLHQKHGSDYWMMSLRGYGTRYVAVGNIFSGLFCPVKEDTNHKIESVRIPRPLGNDFNEFKAEKHKTWRDAPALIERKKKLRRNLKKVRPHEVTHDLTSGLVIRGEHLFEWAHVSSETYIMETTNIWGEEGDNKAVGQAVEGEIVPRPMEASPSDASSLNAHATFHGPMIVLKTEDSNEEPQLLLKTSVGESISAKVTAHNVGTTAVFYEWERAANDAKDERFFCLDKTGMILPGRTKSFSFSFASNRAGLFSDSWTLKTTPPNIVERQGSLTCELTGIAACLDETIPARDMIKERLRQRVLETSVREILDGVVRSVRTPEKVYTPEERKNMLISAFEYSNRHLGAFYTDELFEDLETLAQMVFQTLHSGVGIAEERNAAIQESLASWKSEASMEALFPAIESIREGKPLHPPSRVPTVVEEDGSGLWDGSFDGSSEGGEEEEEEKVEQEEEIDMQVAGEEFRRGSLVAQREMELVAFADESTSKLKRILERSKLRPLENSIGWTIASSLLSDIGESVCDIVEQVRATAAAKEAERAEEAKANEDGEGTDDDGAEDNRGSDDDDDGDDDDDDEEDQDEDEEGNTNGVWYRWRKDPLGRESRERVWTAIGDMVERFVEQYDEEASRIAAENCSKRRHDCTSKITIEDYCSTNDISGKLVMLRTCLNLPFSRENPDELDASCADRTLVGVSATIKCLQEKGASAIVLVGHRGTDFMNRALTSTRPVAEALQQRLGQEVDFIEDDDCLGQNAADALAKIRKDVRDVAANGPCPIYMLQNMLYSDRNEDMSSRLGSFADLVVCDSLEACLDAHALSLPFNGSCPLPLMGKHLESEMRTLSGILQAPNRPIVAVVGGAFPDLDAGYLDDDETENVNGANDSDEAGALLRAASPVSSSPDDDADDENELLWPAPAFEPTLRSQLDFIRNSINNEQVDVLLIAGGLVSLFRAALFSLGEGAEALLNDPGPPPSFNGDDDESDFGEAGDGAESPVAEESTALNDPSSAVVSEGGAEEEQSYYEGSPRESVNDEGKDEASEEGDGPLPPDAETPREEDEGDEDERSQFDPLEVYYEEIIELFMESRKRAIAWRFPLDIVVGPLKPSRPTSDASLALMHDSVYEGSSAVISLEDDHNQSVLKENFVLDLGPKTLSRWTGIISRSNTVIFAGLPGAAQYEEFQNGTRALLECAAQRCEGSQNATCVIVDKGISDNLEGIGVSAESFSQVSLEPEAAKRYVSGKTIVGASLLLQCKDIESEGDVGESGEQAGEGKDESSAEAERLEAMRSKLRSIRSEILG